MKKETTKDVNSYPSWSYPSWACNGCGTKHGRKVPKVASWHYGKCDVCEKNHHVAKPRDLGHFPNWFIHNKGKK